MNDHEDPRAADRRRLRRRAGPPPRRDPGPHGPARPAFALVRRRRRRPRHGRGGHHLRGGHQPRRRRRHGPRSRADRSDGRRRRVRWRRTTSARRRTASRLYREFANVDASIPKLEASLALLESGPADPDYTTAWGPDSFVGASVQGDVIYVDLADESLHDRPAGMSKAEAELAIEQVIYTVQGALGQGAAARAVPAQRQPHQRGLRRAHQPSQLGNSPQLDVLALVSITDPAEGTTVSGTLHREGRRQLLRGDRALADPGRRRGAVVLEGFATADGCHGQALAVGDRDRRLRPRARHLHVRGADRRRVRRSRRAPGRRTTRGPSSSSRSTTAHPDQRRMAAMTSPRSRSLALAVAATAAAVVLAGCGSDDPDDHRLRPRGQRLPRRRSPPTRRRPTRPRPRPATAESPPTPWPCRSTSSATDRGDPCSTASSGRSRPTTRMAEAAALLTAGDTLDPRLPHAVPGRRSFGDITYDEAMPDRGRAVRDDSWTPGAAGHVEGRREARRAVAGLHAAGRRPGPRARSSSPSDGQPTTASASTRPRRQGAPTSSTYSTWST